MPFIKAKVSCQISEEQEIELKAGIGKAIELVPGKSEESLLLEFEDNCRLWLRGRNEESIGGLPINMDGFRLFDREHRSSKPLNLAYKAAQLADPEKSDAFLTELRHAAVIDCLPTTHFDEILKVVRKMGINETTFKQYYQDGSAENALVKDLEYTHRLGIHSLPAYLIQYDEKALIMQSFVYQEFINAINGLLN